jgi:hypothetical protein
MTFFAPSLAERDLGMRIQKQGKEAFLTYQNAFFNDINLPYVPQVRIVGQMPYLRTRLVVVGVAQPVGMR